MCSVTSDMRLSLKGEGMYDKVLGIWFLFCIEVQTLGRFSANINTSELFHTGCLIMI